MHPEGIVGVFAVQQIGTPVLLFELFIDEFDGSAAPGFALAREGGDQVDKVDYRPHSPGPNRFAFLEPLGVFSASSLDEDANFLIHG